MAGFSSVVDRLIPQGSVARGVQPNLITQDGQVIPNGQTDTLSRFNRALKSFQAEQQKKEEQRRKEMAEKTSMYRTLREAGYEPDRAFRAVQEGRFPDEVPGKTDDELESEAKVDKLEAQTDKTKAETDKINAERKAVPNTLKNITDRIVSKIANDEELTNGEQKVFDEVIRKFGNQGDIETILNNKGVGKDGKKVSKSDKSGDTKNFIKMTDPQGKKRKVHPDDVSQALAEGWRLR
jgi:vacuolar-type H+-ATPase subunit I/STV1